MTTQPRLTPLQQLQKFLQQSPEHTKFSREELLPLFEMAVRDEIVLMEETFQRGWCDRGYDRNTMSEYFQTYLSQFKQDDK
jgi:hypothetical protein